MSQEFVSRLQTLNESRRTRLYCSHEYPDLVSARQSDSNRAFFSEADESRGIASSNIYDSGKSIRRRTTTVTMTKQQRGDRQLNQSHSREFIKRKPDSDDDETTKRRQATVPTNWVNHCVSSDTKYGSLLQAPGFHKDEMSETVITIPGVSYSKKSFQKRVILEHKYQVPGNPEFAFALTHANPARPEFLGIAEFYFCLLCHLGLLGGNRTVGKMPRFALVE
ncbi:unnamed protein product [Notodromas monacha]|uniref:Uncharacterized protein n=1 Tax=Notodromas monacha TaxID=399045 RepID=A0A7R9BPN0_9CRUS|nr:unnamed protein product [Notodromas monacha]CAG0918003.1 unnamed protein product [Notodromas monacha]